MRFWLFGVALLAGCGNALGQAKDLSRVNHIVVIFMENRSFDNVYGELPGVDGITAATSAMKQTDASNVEYATLPTAGAPIPATLPNAPFSIEQYVPANTATRDLVHRFYQEQQQINGGKMDKFVLVSDAKALAMGYYHSMQLPIAALASQYTVLDRFFHAAFGGSFLNHIWLVAAASPPFPNAPSGLVATVDAQGNMVTDGAVSPDGYGINTLQPANTPTNPVTPAGNRMPALTIPNIGDRLSEKNVTWAWYAGGWNDAVAGTPTSLYQYHHQPFVYWAAYGPGTPGRAAHLKDEAEFVQAAMAGTLPAVSFVKPLGQENEHPGYADILTGQNHVVNLVNAVKNGPNWKDAAIIITYDENGGFWDHVAPPAGDRWGPGTRIPAMVISPFARAGFVDHKVYDTTSILALIEKRFGISALGTRDAAADPLSGAFDFSK